MSAAVAIPDYAIGALLAGNLLGVIAYGFTVSQAYMYYTYLHAEPLLTRIFVLLLWATETANTAIMSHSQYFYFITNYAVPAVLETPVWSFSTVVLLTVIVSFMIRMLFVQSVWKMSHSNKLLSGGLALLSVANLALGVILMLRTRKVTDGNYQTIQAWVYLTLGTAILADACIAVVHCLYLPKQKNINTPRNRFDALIIKFKTYVVGTGLLSIFLTIVILVLYAAVPSKFIFIAPFMIWSKTYTNSYFTATDARRRRERGPSVSVTLSSGGTHSRLGTGRQPGSAIRTALPTQVNIVQETTVEHDDDIKYQSNFAFAKAF